MNMYQQAINVQDACNPSGVIIAFGNVAHEVWDELRAEGKYSTEEFKRHPVAILFMNKLNDMIGEEATKALLFCKAYDIAEAKAKQ